MATVGDILFYGNRRSDRATLSDLTRHILTKSVAERVNKVSKSVFDKHDDATICERLGQELAIDPIELDLAASKGDVKEARITVQDHFNGTVQVDGLTITKRIPFKGDADLWELRPSQYDSGPPHGQISSNILVVGLEVRVSDQERAIEHIKQTISQVEAYIARQVPEIDAFNNALPGTILPLLQKRRELLNAAEDLSSRLDGI